MSEYTPDTASLRYAWRKHRDQVAAKGNMSAYSAEFDRWLAAHDAGVKAEAFKRGQQVLHEDHQCCAAAEEARNLLFRRGMPRWVKIAKLHELFSVVPR
jgi:hypothetical protein